MDTHTLFLAIGLAYGAFGVLLLALERPSSAEEPLGQLAVAFLLMATGTLLQYGRGSLPDLVSVFLGNLVALLGLAYQAFAVRAVAGRPASRRTRVSTVVVLVAVTLTIVPLDGSHRITVASLLYAAGFAVPAVALLGWRDGPPTVRTLVGGGFALVAALYALRAFEASQIGGNLVLFSDSGAVYVTEALYPLVFLVALTTGFGLLLLTKRSADDRLQTAIEEMSTILDALPSGVLIVDRRHILRTNPALDQMAGYEPGELVGRSTRVFYTSDEQYDALGAAVYGQMERLGESRCEAMFLRKDGHPFWVWMQARPLPGPPGSRHAVLAVTEITDLKHLQDELARQATYDDLTGLPNRRSFLDRAPVELAHAHRTGRPLCVAVFDLDRFKLINDGHGHAVGDRALQAVAAACRRTFRDHDLVARIGGDEIVAVLPDSDLAQGTAAMERLRATVADSPLAANGYEVELAISVGVAELRADDSLDDVLARADHAMYASKATGGNAVSAESVPEGLRGAGEADTAPRPRERGRDSS